jgi:serine/threonine protein kinase
MSQSDSASREPDISEQQTLPDDVLEALGKGRLTDIQFLSSGATSSVFRAHDSRLDKTIAIKFLKHADQKGLISFQTEARLASKLNHDNLVRILNFGVTQNNHAFLIMEFVDGSSLDTIIDETLRIPVELAIHLLMQVCDGLAHAHGKKIAHRDLKTANILVQGYGSSNMRAIVVDFGLAQQRESQERLGNTSGRIKGSPLFISPEQAQGLNGDERSDIYSLGCVAFYMLTGRLPFESDDLFDILRMHAEKTAPSLSSAAPNLEFPPALTSCVAQMLEKDPAKRFQTIQEVNDKLARASMPERAAKVSPVVSRKVRFWPIVVFALIVLIPVVLFLTHQEEPANKPVATSAKLSPVEPAREKFNRLYTYRRGNFLSHFNYIYVCPKNSGTMTDEDLACLAQVSLSTPDVNLAFTNITGIGLEHLRSIEGLKLDLSKTSLSPKGFEALGTLRNMEAVSLIGAKIRKSEAPVVDEKKDCRDISQTELDAIANCKNLLELNLDTCAGVNDSCIEAINKLPLRVFTARDAGLITNKGVSALAKCEDLKFVHLDGADIDDEAVDELSRSGKFVDFRVNRCKKLTGKSLKMIAERNPQLKYVAVSFTQSSSKDLHYLAGKDMTFLELMGIPIGPEELKLFGTMRNLRTLYVSKVKDPDSLKYLYPLAKADQVVLYDSPNLDKNAVQQLQKHLRGTVATGDDRAVPADMQEFKNIFMDSSDMDGDTPEPQTAGAK